MSCGLSKKQATSNSDDTAGASGSGAAHVVLLWAWLPPPAASVGRPESLSNSRRDTRANIQHILLAPGDTWQSTPRRPRTSLGVCMLTEVFLLSHETRYWSSTIWLSPIPGDAVCLVGELPLRGRPAMPAGDRCEAWLRACPYFWTKALYNQERSVPYTQWSPPHWR